MAFALFIPIDPWIIPLSRGPELSEAVFAVLVTGLGTMQWWAIGWLIGRLFKRGPNKPLANL